jgi:hypothetical protein
MIFSLSTIGEARTVLLEQTMIAFCRYRPNNRLGPSGRLPFLLAYLLSNRAPTTGSYGRLQVLEATVPPAPSPAGWSSLWTTKPCAFGKTDLVDHDPFNPRWRPDATDSENQVVCASTKDRETARLINNN